MNDVAGLVDAEQICSDSFIRHVELHESLPSTNDRAIELAGVAELELPVLVLARRQTVGRGRGSNRWWSTDGALTFSLLMESAKLRITSRDWPRLSLTTAVAVCDAVQAESREQRAGSSEAFPAPRSSLPARCSIKWPNDVLVGGRKVCGILIESPGGAAPANDRLIVGVGINVNNSWRDAPSDAGPGGTALCDASGKQHNLQRVLIRFLRALERRLEQLAGRDPQLPSTWQALCWLRGKRLDVDVGGRHVVGRCLGIANDGALLLQTTIKTERLHAGSVRVVS